MEFSTRGFIIVLLSAYYISSALAVSSNQCHHQIVLKELYRSLYRVINENAVCSNDRSITNIELVGKGLPLSYLDFNPRKPSRFSRPGTLPLIIIEKALPLVDKIYPTESSRFKVFSNASASIKNYQHDSFSSMYDYILAHMMLLPQNFSDQDVLRAKYYLQELVPNPERVLRNESKLPRYLLYDYYRSYYINQKGLQDDAIDTNRTTLTQKHFEIWGQRKLSGLESDTASAYHKWQAFGYKSEVEKQLQYFEFDTHENKLMSRRALFKSLGRPSDSSTHNIFYPFTLEPENWFKHLEVSISESSDELRYRKSLLQTQQALLNGTNIELNSKTTEDVNATLQEIERNIIDLKALIKSATDKLLQMEVDCFTKINLTVCSDIIEGHAAFRYILQDVAEHFAQAEYLQSILNGREDTIKIIVKKLSTLESELRLIDTKIAKAEDEERSESIDAGTSSDADVASCPGVSQIKFTFDSRNIADLYDGFCDSNTQDKNCIDIEVPLNVTNKNLWNVHSCAVDSELNSSLLYQNFISLMNISPFRITASLLKVNVERPWFDPSIFEDEEHYTMKRGSGVVSPGPLNSKAYFQRVAHSGQYLLPHYVSAFILTSDIKIFYPGLGSWNYTENNSDNENVINIMMRYAYAQVLTGNIGPFSFELPTGYDHNYQLRRENGGLMLTLPGGQVVGYLLKTIPRFPFNQTAPSYQPMQCDENPTGVPLRKKRSMNSEDFSAPSKNMKQIAMSLFSEGAPHIDADKDKLGGISAGYIENVIKEGTVTMERVSRFVNNIQPNTAGHSLNN